MTPSRGTSMTEDGHYIPLHDYNLEVDDVAYVKSKLFSSLLRNEHAAFLLGMLEPLADHAFSSFSGYVEPCA